MNPCTVSCFSSLLLRGDDGWRWRDGTPEPRVGEASPWAIDLRTREEGAVPMVEVPISLAQHFDPLRWVLDAVTEGRFDVDVTTGAFAVLGRTIGSAALAEPADRRQAAATGVMVVLVPLSEWRAWCATCDVVALWRPEDEVELQRKAIALAPRDGGATPSRRA